MKTDFASRVQLTPEAQLAIKEQQIAVAERVLVHQGGGAWPVCGRSLSESSPGRVSLPASGTSMMSPDQTDLKDVAARLFDGRPTELISPDPRPDLAGSLPAGQDVPVDAAPPPSTDGPTTVPPSGQEVASVTTTCIYRYRWSG